MKTLKAIANRIWNGNEEHGVWKHGAVRPSNAAKVEAQLAARGLPTPAGIEQWA